MYSASFKTFLFQGGVSLAEIWQSPLFLFVFCPALYQHTILNLSINHQHNTLEQKTWGCFFLNFQKAYLLKGKLLKFIFVAVRPLRKCLFLRPPLTIHLIVENEIVKGQKKMAAKKYYCIDSVCIVLQVFPKTFFLRVNWNNCFNIYVTYYIYSRAF